MHVLVDPELALLRLLRVVAARRRGARVPSLSAQTTPPGRVTRAISRTIARQVERVVQRGDAVREVEARVAERQVLAVGLHALERRRPARS